MVGFDARYNSKKWATLTAQVFSNEGVRVRLFSDICPTPYVAFCTRLHGLCVGVMCTASHNPKEDNGYKVYWNNGAQSFGIRNARDFLRDLKIFPKLALFLFPLSIPVS